jgi:hypothetical protein
MDKVLRILAFGGAILAGILCIVFAVMYRTPALYAWAVAAFFGGVTGFLFAQKAQPAGSISGPTVGGKFIGLPDWVTYADFALVAIALILSFVLR